MKLKIVVISLFAICSFSNFSLLQDGTILFIQADQITPDSYKDLVLASLENDSITIEEACVPAKLVKINFSGSNVSHIKSFFKDKAGLENIVVLSNFNEDQFTQKCLNARVGR